MPLEIVRNDITQMAVDAIVNAANTSLLGGGGVDGAIHKAAGPGLLAECRGLNGCETGQAKITGGYLLPAKYVIHTVGPIWQGGGHGEAELLASCYQKSLELARAYHCATVAFPMISAGAYGYPKDQALAIAVDTIGRFLMENDMTVYMVVFARAEYTISKKLFKDVQEYIDDHYVDDHISYNIEKRRRLQWQQDAEKALEMDRELAGASAPDGFYRPEDMPDVLCDVPSEAAQQRPRHKRRPASSSARPAAPAPQLASSAPDWDQLLRQTDEGFSGMLLRKIDERGMTDAQCYKKANVDRKLFSKIRSHPDYRPSKPTVFAFAVALELSLEETTEMLNKAGFALSHSSKFDIILEYFIQARNFNVFEINEVLFHYDMPLLGC